MILPTQSADRWGGRARPGLLAPGATYYLLASTFFVVVFVLVPFSLYEHANEKWEFRPELMVGLAGVGLAALAGAVLALRLLAMLSETAARALAVALFCLGGWLLLASVYAPIGIGPLDGAVATSQEPLHYSLIEAAALVVSLAAFVALCRGRGAVAACLFTMGLWVVSLGYLLGVGWPAEEATETTRAAQSATLDPACTAEGNVYHIVLDTLQTDAARQVTDQNDWAKSFTGFTLFANNIANYLVTSSSKASYLTGTFYHRGDLRAWRRSFWRDGIFEHLKRADYKIWMAAPFPSWRHPFVDVFQSNPDYYRNDPQLADSQFYEFLWVWLTNLVPNALTNEAITAARAAALVLFERLPFTRVGVSQKPGGQRRPLLMETGLHAYASARMLEQLAIDEPKRGPACHYVYAHALLPHQPFVLERDCRFVGPPSKRAEPVGLRRAYLSQAACALGRVAGFLDRLKQLGRYEKATIVVQADTGNWIRLAALIGKRRTVLGRSEAKLLASVQALLMIKPPLEQGPLQIANTPTQLVDVYPTLLDLLHLETPPGVHGRSIYASQGREPREARFALDPEAANGSNLIEVRIEQPDELRVSPLRVLGPATDPALWRHEVRRARVWSLAPVAASEDP